VDIEKITVCETVSLLYPTRKYLPNRVFCEGVKVYLPFAAFPSEKTESAIEVLGPLYLQEDGKRGFLFPLKNVLLAALTNGNPVTHVPMMLLKAVDVELGEEPYWKCGDSTAIKLMKRALDREMIQLQIALGFKPLSHDYVHNTLMYPPWAPLIDSTDPECDAELPKWVIPSNQPGLYAAGQRRNFLQMRYLTEDIPYALVGLSNLGDLLNVPTPVIDAAITLASTITGTNYWHTGRTLEKLGIAHFNKEELLRYVG
jgi:opine dehydrogenase